MLKILYVSGEVQRAAEEFKTSHLGIDKYINNGTPYRVFKLKFPIKYLHFFTLHSYSLESYSMIKKHNSTLTMTVLFFSEKPFLILKPPVFSHSQTKPNNIVEGKIRGTFIKQKH